jgi:ABC-type polysaccharide/polyol phosphate transport system ATPase subunit
VNAPAELNKEASAGSAQEGPLAISVRGVRKAYKIYDKPLSFLSEVITGQRAHREKEVLSDINIDVRRGEVVGIIGRNGAGKSTLLKMIAGTLAPSSGAIEVTGRVSAILELGTGFNPAYSGRDNVIMSALMRGMPEAEIRKKFDSIVAFAALEDVIDQPFHTYSSGMQARLAFAAAVAVEADVIIIDEALAAGDIRFTARSLRRVREICESGVTALFVSHQTYHVMQLCTRAIWIDEGRIRMDGDPLEVCRTYEYEMHEAVARDEGRMAAPAPSAVATATPATPSSAPPNSAAQALDGARQIVAPAGAPRHSESAGAAPADQGLAEGDAAPRFETHQYRITSVDFLDGNGSGTLTFRFGEPMRLRVRYECLLDTVPEHSCGLAVAVTSVPDHQAVMYFNTNYPHSDAEMLRYGELPFRQYRGRTGVIEAKLPCVQLRPGEYRVSLGILPNRQDLHEFYEYRHMAYRIVVLPNGFPEPSVFYALVEWEHGPVA